MCYSFLVSFSPKFYHIVGGALFLFYFQSVAIVSGSGLMVLFWWYCWSYFLALLVFGSGLSSVAADS
jgi:hypothetical protein